MDGTLQIPTQRRASPRPAVDLDQLARRVIAATAARGSGDHMGMFPSERELARQLDVSRHLVRLAIDRLEQQGLVKRLPGRGSISMAARPAAIQACPVRCINFLQGPSHQNPALHWLVKEYLAGYTEVLDLYDINARHVYWEDDRQDFDGTLWPQAPQAQQACVLVNRRVPRLLNWLGDHGVPYVVQNTAAYDDQHLPPHHRVYINKMGAAFDAVRHLLELGHRRIGFLGQLPSNQALWPEYEGWAAALRCAGLSTPASACVQMVTEEPQVAIDGCRPLLERPDRPTAVLSGHGAGTLALKLCAQSLGLHVPRDLSVIGFDSDLTHPHHDLSTLEVPRRELARSAVRMAIEVAHRPATPWQLCVLHCRMLLRGSTAAPGSLRGIVER
jgi:DNA-binding LacI/PurR family transcriptional regulator